MKLLLSIFILAFCCSCNIFINSIIKANTRRPISDLKVNYITKHEKIIDSISIFNVSLIDSNFNIFKTEGLLNVKIEGIIYDSIFFENIKIFENQTSTTSIKQSFYDRESNKEIILIPNFSRKKRRQDHTEYQFIKGKMYFKTNLEFKIYSFNFGTTNYKIRINDISRNIKIFHSK
jgi:hypothetical protein